MNWEPAHADHAIDSVLIVVTFADLVDANTFDEMVVAGRKAAAEFHFTNRVDLQEAIPQQLKPGQAIIEFGNLMQRRRVAFQRVVNGLVIGELSVGMQAMHVTTTQYKTWTEFESMVQRLVEALNEVVPIKEKMKSIQLQYIDRFDSTAIQADYFEVVSKDSPYIPKNAATKSRAMHVHTGWFDYSGDDYRTLTNVNIDIVDNSQPAPQDAKSRISFLTFSRLDALQGVIQEPFLELNRLHRYLKDLFGTIITDEAAARISLNN